MTSGAEPKSTNGAQRAPRGNGEHILYVDDEAPMVTLAARSLDMLGYRVTGALSPGEALSLFRQDPQAFDLVVTDYQMPGGSGLDMVSEMMQLRPGLPVILATGLLAPRDEERVREAGIRELFLKPYTPRELGDLVYRTLREKPRR